MTRRGIVLFNLGGPAKVSDVKPFLYNLFSDPDILVGVPAPFRQLLAFTIAQVKGPSSIRTYEQIGGGSPQLKWTTRQAELLTEALLSRDPHIETRVVVGMRAWEPSIEAALGDLRAWGAEELVFFPLFPHFSTTTTGSCFKEAHRQLGRLGWSPRVREIRSWPAVESYVALWRAYVREKIEAATEQAQGAPVHVLFSAHSLPLKIIERGDPYPTEVEATIRALTRDLEHSWSLAYQSRNGKLPWLEPYTEDELARLGREGVRDVVVVPLSFVSDHIETLYELDLLYADHARGHGIERYHRAATFNDDPRFIQVLLEVLDAHAGHARPHAS